MKETKNWLNKLIPSAWITQQILSLLFQDSSPEWLHKSTPSGNTDKSILISFLLSKSTEERRSSTRRDMFSTVHFGAAVNENASKWCAANTPVARAERSICLPSQQPTREAASQAKKQSSQLPAPKTHWHAQNPLSFSAARPPACTFDKRRRRSQKVTCTLEEDPRASRRTHVFQGKHCLGVTAIYLCTDKQSAERDKSSMRIFRYPLIFWYARWT
jgi:hypothetical protein